MNSTPVRFQLALTNVLSSMADTGDYVAYAADGYARIKGISALITTFGVGKRFIDLFPNH